MASKTEPCTFFFLRHLDLLASDATHIPSPIFIIPSLAKLISILARQVSNSAIIAEPLLGNSARLFDLRAREGGKNIGNHHGCGDEVVRYEVHIRRWMGSALFGAEL